MTRASRAWTGDALASMFDFGKVVSSELSTSAKSLLARIRGNDAADDTPAEEVVQQEVWGHAAILWRPLADTEVLFIRRGEELMPVASREVRWQVDIAEGDVVVRALGENKPRLILRADGTCLLEADEIKLGDSGATEAIALGTVLKTYLNDLRTYVGAIATAYSTHNHPTAPTGPVSPPSVAIVGSNPTVPDIESRHKVEN